MTVDISIGSRGDNWHVKIDGEQVYQADDYRDAALFRAQVMVTAQMLPDLGSAAPKKQDSARR